MWRRHVSFLAILPEQIKALPFNLSALFKQVFLISRLFFLSTFYSKILWALSPHLSFWAHHSVCQSLHFPLFFCLLVPLCLRSRGPSTPLQVKDKTENLCSRPTHICPTPILYPILRSSLSGPPCKVTSWPKVLCSLFNGVLAHLFLLTLQIFIIVSIIIMAVCIFASQPTFLQTQISVYFHSIFIIPLSPTALRKTVLQPPICR